MIWFPQKLLFVINGWGAKAYFANVLCNTLVAVQPGIAGKQFNYIIE